MTALTYRDVKGFRLTNEEVDANWRALVADIAAAAANGGATKVDKAGDTMTGTLTIGAPGSILLGTGGNVSYLNQPASGVGMTGGYVAGIGTYGTASVAYPGQWAWFHREGNGSVYKDGYILSLRATDVGSGSVSGHLFEFHGRGDFAASGGVFASRLSVGYDPQITNSIACSDWFRTSGANAGLYFAAYVTGVRGPMGSYGSVQTYGAKNGWGGYSISEIGGAGGVIFMHLVGSGATGQWGIYNHYSNFWYLNSDSSGNVTFNGNVTAYSDRRLKRDIAPIKGALGRLLRLTGVSFERIDSGERGLGLIAQDVQLEFPEVVAETSPSPESAETVLSVAYGNLMGPVIEALREIDSRLRVLEEA